MIRNPMRALLGLTRPELERLSTELGTAPHRGRQLSSWIYGKGANSFKEMTDLPQGLRERLSQQFQINPLRMAKVLHDSDGTTKYLFEMGDGQSIETVRLPHWNWETICVSTQAGCPIGCAFCASGRDFVRNLKAGEIAGQILLARKREHTNIVFMGTGEPLLNHRELFSSLELLNQEVGIGARSITVSTVGITKRIRELADFGMEVNLAISLHAPSDELRRRLIPAALPPIRDIIHAAEYFFEKTKRRVSFEYVLLSGVNDLPEHAGGLARLLKAQDFKLHLNLIPYNETVARFKKPSPEKVREFKHSLAEQGINATIRNERGKSIRAACGQLRRQSPESVAANTGSIPGAGETSVLCNPE